MRFRISKLALCGVLACAASPSLLATGGLTFVPLDEPCRLMDTRIAQGGPGPLSQAHGNYKFGTSNADIQSTGQNGNSAGCGIPAGAAAITASIDQLDTTAPGDIRMWSTDDGTTGPSAGTAVYNPSVPAPGAGQVIYNGASVFVSVGATDQRFYISVANGQLDMTINVVGYWVASAPTSYTFSLGNANFAWNSTYVYNTSTGSYTEYFTRYHVVSIPAITQQVLDSGSVEVYFNPDPSVNTNHWEHLPYRFLDGFSGFYYVLAPQTKLAQVEIDFFFEQINASATIPTLSTYPVPTYKFKVVVTPSSQSTAIASP